MKFERVSSSYGYDDQILNLLKNSQKPISAHEISLLTGISHVSVLKKIKTLEKFGSIFCSTKKQVRFWKIKDASSSVQLSNDTELPDEPYGEEGSEMSATNLRGGLNGRFT